MPFIDGHDCSIGFVLPVQSARAHDLFVDEGRLARCAGAIWTFVVHFVEAKPFSEINKIDK